MSPLNGTCIQPDPLALKLRLWQYSLYGMVGGCAFLLNTIVSLSIFKYRALRKEETYQLIGYLSLADSIFGRGHLVGAAYRLTLFNLDSAYCPIPRIWCMFTPQMFLWRLGVVTAPMMLVMVSWHRMVAVAHPLALQTVSKKIALAYGTGILFSAAQWIYPVATAETQVPAYCGTRFVLHNGLYRFEVFFCSLAAVVSCGLYGLLLIKLHKHNAVTTQEDDRILQDQIDLERRLTITLGISSLLTFVFVCLPNAMVHASLTPVVKRHLPMLAKFSSYTSILLQGNAVANFFLYGLRQKEMNKAIKGLLIGQHLPENLRDWHINVPVAWQG